MSNIPFQNIDWTNIQPEQFPGETGYAVWKTIRFPGLRIREVEYSANYKADHWCQKGHLVHCLEGELVTEMENGESYVLKKGMSYIVSDDLSSHRSVTRSGARILVVDGDFLKLHSE
jgi:hypothetical protein